MSTSTVSVNLPLDKELIFSTRLKNKYVVPFRPIGESSMKKSKAIDALECICLFSKQELALCLRVKRTMAKNNKVVISQKELTEKERRQLGTGIRSWIKKGLIKRIQKEHYMVNPWFLVPSDPALQVIAVNEWEELA